MGLNEDVAKMMGWERVNIHREDHDPWWTWQSADGLMHRSCVHWKPSQNWNQAVLVIGWMKEQGFTRCNISLDDRGSSACFYHLSKMATTCWADTGPLAICHAALAAMGCQT